PPDDPPPEPPGMSAARSATVPPVVRAAPASRKVAGLVEPINVNRADLAELQKLPGIGPKLSQRIVDERTLRGPFKTVDELRRVPGICPKTVEKLRPHVAVGPPASVVS